MSSSYRLLRLATELARCAGSWSAEARLLGNLRADEIGDVARAVLRLHEENERLKLSEADKDALWLYRNRLMAKGATRRPHGRSCLCRLESLAGRSAAMRDKQCPFAYWDGYCRCWRECLARRPTKWRWWYR